VTKFWVSCAVGTCTQFEEKIIGEVKVIESRDYEQWLESKCWRLYFVCYCLSNNLKCNNELYLRVTLTNKSRTHYLLLCYRNTRDRILVSPHITPCSARKVASESTSIMFLDIMHRLVYFKKKRPVSFSKHVSETLSFEKETGRYF
jgi:hypothetical protein